MASALPRCVSDLRRGLPSKGVCFPSACDCVPWTECLVGDEALLLDGHAADDGVDADLELAAKLARLLREGSEEAPRGDELSRRKEAYHGR